MNEEDFAIAAAREFLAWDYADDINDVEVHGPSCQSCKQFLADQAARVVQLATVIRRYAHDYSCGCL